MKRVLAKGERGRSANRLQNIPALCMNVGPMLNGYNRTELTGSGTVVWKARELLATGDINEAQFVDYISTG